MKKLVCLLVAWSVVAHGLAVGQPKDDVPALIKQLKDPDEINRFKAAKALGKLGVDAEEAIPALTKATKDTDEDVRRAAKQSLEKIKAAVSSAGRKEAMDAIEEHSRILKGGDPTAVAKAIEGLCKMLKSADEIVRLSAVKAIGEGGSASKEALVTLKELAKDDDEAVREYAKKAIGKVTSAVNSERRKKALEVLAPLLKDLKSAVPGTKMHALEEIAKLGADAKEASQDVVQAMLDPYAAVGETAAITLEKINPELQKPVLTVMVDQNSTSRREAIRSIGQMRGDGRAALPLLLFCVRYGSMEGLPSGRWPGSGEKARFPRATPRVNPHQSYWVEALQAMCEVAPDDKTTVKIVVDLVSAPVAPMTPYTYGRTSTRAVALDLLGKVEVEPKVAVGALIAALNDPYHQARVIEDLIRHGAEAKDALPALRRLKFSTSATIREAAGRAIEKIEEK